jgi:threonine/homoserine/homoserine lactone efflux protein
MPITITRSKDVSPVTIAPRSAYPASEMLELLAIGAVAFGVGLSGALTPGPLTVLAIREAARRGWKAGPYATLGHAVAELVLVIALALGLAALVDDEGAATAVIALLGGGVLLYMGVGLLREAPHASLEVEFASTGVLVAAPAGAGGAVTLAAPPASSHRRAALGVAASGVLASVINPYWVIWWATVGAKLTSDSLSAGWPGPGAVFAGHILSDLIWLTGIAVLIHRGSERFGVRWYRGLLGVCGAFLLALGAFFVVSGVGFVR